MKTWKLVSGILSIAFFFMVAFQSCAAGMVNSISGNGEVSGSAGIIVAFMLLCGGIVSICSRNGSRGLNIALIVLYGIGAFFGFVLAGTVFTDLYLWATWCLVNAILAAVCLKRNKK